MQLRYSLEFNIRTKITDKIHHHPSGSLMSILDNKDNMGEDKGILGIMYELIVKSLIKCFITHSHTSICASIGNYDDYKMSNDPQV